MTITLTPAVATIERDIGGVYSLEVDHERLLHEMESTQRSHDHPLPSINIIGEDDPRVDSVRTAQGWYAYKENDITVDAAKSANSWMVREQYLSASDKVAWVFRHELAHWQIRDRRVRFYRDRVMQAGPFAVLISFGNLFNGTIGNAESLMSGDGLIQPSATGVALGSAMIAAGIYMARPTSGYIRRTSLLTHHERESDRIADTDLERFLPCFELTPVSAHG